MIRALWRETKIYALPILAGVLVGTSYIPFPPWALLFCLAPLWIFILQNAESWRQALLAGWITQFVLSLIGFHWIASVAHEFGYLPWPLAALALFVFAAGVHLYFPLAAALGFYLRKRFQLKDFSSLVILSSAVALFENFWPSLFPWNLGYAWLGAHSPVAQWADTIGFLGLSWLTHLLSAVAAYLWIRRDKAFTMKVLAAAFAVIAVLHWSGNQKSKQWEKTDASLNVLYIQANIGNFEKLMAEKGRGYQQEIMDRYFSETRQALQAFPQAQLVLWPETAFPAFLDNSGPSRKFAAQLRDLIKDIRKPLLTGAFSQDSGMQKNAKDYNALFLYKDDGELAAPPYRKTALLSFGESTPLVDWIPALAAVSPAEDGFGKGNGPTVLAFENAKLGVQICYESLDASFTRELSQKGAEILVNLTNDSWFGTSFEPWQHLYMTLGRAIEARRPLLRSTNTGVTTSILASGEILSLSPIHQSWSQQHEIRYLKNPPLSFYTRYGQWLPVLIWIVGCLAFFLGKKPSTAVENPDTSQMPTDSH